MKALRIIEAILFVAVCVCFFVVFNLWCAGLPRTCALWHDGAFCAYVQANILALIACLMVSVPYILTLESTED